MRRNGILALTIAVVAASCAPLQSPELQRLYRPSAVVQNIESLDGHQVRIAGYLRLGVETRALWDSPEHFGDAQQRRAVAGDPIWNHCITAYYDYSIETEVENAAGSMIDAVGTVGIDRDEGTGIDLWGCNPVHITIHRLNR